MGFYQLVLLADLQALLFGYTVSFTGATLNSIIRATDICPGETVCERAALVASIAPLGALVSSIFSGRLTDAIGRQQTLLLNCAVFVVGYSVLATATGLTGLLVGRFFAGVATGVASTVVPVYVTEVTPPGTRGPLGGLFNVSISTGIMLVFALGVSGTDDGWWRVMAALGCVPALACAAAILLGYLPETPRWLATMGRLDEARGNAEEIFGGDAALVADALGGERKRGSAGTFEGGAVAPEESPYSRKNAPAVFAGVGIVCCFALTGNNVLQAYMTEILVSLGLTPNQASLGGAAYAGTQLIFAFAMFGGGIAAFGRKPLLLGSACGATLCLAGMAASSLAGVSVLVVVFACGFITSLTAGLSTLSWVYAAEVFPDAVRGRAMSIATLAFWGATFVLIESYTPLAKAVSVPGVLLLFAGCCACSAAFVAVYVAETRGCSLNDVAALFAPKDPDQLSQDSEEDPLLKLK